VGVSLAVRGGQPPFYWSLVGGTLPTGLNFELTTL